MKAIHITAKILLKIASIALIAVLVVSVIPIVSGGISLDVKKAPTAAPVDEDTIRIDGSFAVGNDLMWDITDFSYSVKIKNDLFSAGEYSRNNVLIAKGGETEIGFEIDISMTELMLMAISGGLEPGGTIGSMKIPLSLSIGGNYIQGLVGFDVFLDLSVEMEGVSGSISYDSVTGKLEGSADFDVGDILSGVTGTFGAPITATNSSGSKIVEGNVEVIILSDGSAELNFDLAPTSASGLTDLLEALKDTTIKIGDDITLTPEQAEEFIAMIEYILNTIEGGTP
jgi:hypothetical protein